MPDSSTNGNSSNPKNEPPDKNYGDRLAEERTDLANLRTLMAAERTFSSWIRTGLAGVGGGLALTHFLNFQTPWHRYTAYLLGIFLIFWGIAIFIYAAVTYFSSVKRLDSSANWKSHPLRLEFLCGMLILLALATLVMSLHHALF